MKKRPLSILCFFYLATLSGCVGAISMGALGDLGKKYTAQEQTSASSQREITNLSVKYTTINMYTFLLVLPIPTLHSISFEISNPIEDDLIKLQQIFDESGSWRVDTFSYRRRSDGNHGQQEMYWERGIPKQISKLAEPTLHVYLENEKWGDRNPLGTLKKIVNRLSISMSNASTATYQKTFGENPPPK